MFIFRLGISIPNCQHSSQSPIIQPVRKHWRRRQRVTRWKTYQSSAPILPGDMSWLVLSECGWCGPGVCRVFLVFLWFLLVLFCDNHIGQLEKVNTWRYVFVWCFFFLVPSAESWLQFVLEVGGWNHPTKQSTSKKTNGAPMYERKWLLVPKRKDCLLNLHF